IEAGAAPTIAAPATAVLVGVAGVASGTEAADRAAAIHVRLGAVATPVGARNAAAAGDDELDARIGDRAGPYPGARVARPGGATGELRGDPRRGVAGTRGVELEREYHGGGVAGGPGYGGLVGGAAAVVHRDAQRLDGDRVFAGDGDAEEGAPR